MSVSRDLPPSRSTALIAWRNRALGDAILAIPALRALRTLAQHHRLAIAGYPDAWRVIDACCYDEAYPIEDPIFAGLFDGIATAELRAWLERESVRAALAWTTRPFGRALEACGVARMAQALPFPPPGIHAADWLVATVRRLACDADDANMVWPPSPMGPSLTFTARERVQAARRLRALLGAEASERAQPVILHPGSGEAWKRWPAERYAQLADALVDRGVPVLLSAGPSDAGTLAAVRQRMCAQVPVLQGLVARELAACFAQACCYVGNDSGATHLAAAAGAPVVALFGPTDPASWAPRGKVYLLRACAARASCQGQIRVCDDPACLAALSLDEVLAAVTDRLEVAPSSWPRHVA